MFELPVTGYRPIITGTGIFDEKYGQETSNVEVISQFVDIVDACTQHNMTS